jgi:murein DD-endopeptidase MepM/ murein hydrolase activator NlpD
MTDPIKNMVWSKYPEGKVTQWFGENRDLYRRWGLDGHNGIDIVAPHGEPMYAVEDGIVVSVRLDPEGFGKHVRIRSKEPINGVYRCWTYGHCSSIRVVGGAEVREGDHIANMGNTGFVVSGSTPWWKHNPYAGTHLHLGLRLLKEDKNGWKYPDDTIKIQVVDYENGKKGAVDPAPYFTKAKTDSASLLDQLLTIKSTLNSIRELMRKLGYRV